MITSILIVLNCGDLQSQQRELTMVAAYQGKVYLGKPSRFPSITMKGEVGGFVPAWHAVALFSEGTLYALDSSGKRRLVAKLPVEFSELQSGDGWSVSRNGRFVASTWRSNLVVFDIKEAKMLKVHPLDPAGTKLLPSGQAVYCWGEIVSDDGETAYTGMASKDLHTAEGYIPVCAKINLKTGRMKYLGIGAPVAWLQDGSFICSAWSPKRSELFCVLYRNEKPFKEFARDYRVFTDGIRVWEMDRSKSRGLGTKLRYGYVSKGARPEVGGTVFCGAPATWGRYRVSFDDRAN